MDISMDIHIHGKPANGPTAALCWHVWRRYAIVDQNSRGTCNYSISWFGVGHLNVPVRSTPGRQMAPLHHRGCSRQRHPQYLEN